MLTVPWLTARETAALIVVAVSLLFFRVFRERCLLRGERAGSLTARFCG